jgi:hypothetical protein
MKRIHWYYLLLVGLIASLPTAYDSRFLGLRTCIVFGTCLLLILCASAFYHYLRFSSERKRTLAWAKNWFKDQKEKGLYQIGFSSNGLRYRISKKHDLELIPLAVLKEVKECLQAKTLPDPGLI